MNLTMPHHRPNPVIILVFLAALIALAVSVMPQFYQVITHAVIQHGTSAIAVRQCLNDHGAMQEWYNPTTGRTAFLCQLPDGKFGLQIGYKTGDKLQEITTFVKEQLKRLEQVEKYLANRGYQPVQK